MANSLLKTIAHNSFADGIYKEILTRATRYYYFIGKTLPWADINNPPIVINSKAYERETRNEIISMKEVTPGDISYVIPRVNWTSGLVYDIYDDQYSTEIQGLNLSAGGTLYNNSTTITIGTEITNNMNVALNAQYFYGNFLYTVTAAGNIGSNTTNLLGVIGTQYTVNTAKLICVGIRATATCYVNASGIVVSTLLVNRGSGYTISPTVTIAGSGTGAIAIAVITNGVLGATKLEDSRYYVFSNYNVYICVSNNNGALSTTAPTGIDSGYIANSVTTSDGYIWKYITSIPSSSKFLTGSYLPIVTASQNQYAANGSLVNIIIENAGSGYAIASSILPLSTAVTVGEKYYYNGYVYSVYVSGTTGFNYTGIVHTTLSTWTSNTATFVCDGLLTTISVSGDGTGASLTPMITDGRIVGVQINNAGIGYTYANLNVSGEGISASVSAVFTAGISLYSKQSQIESSTIDGNICDAQVISNGYGYSNTPTVSIVGDGTGAIATAVTTNSKITKIVFSNRGSNYNWANITITDSTGNGATARAIISPFGGLGKDPINHLCARSLMFYSKFSDNTNQGLTVINDYRQIGIIKDPLRYKDGTYLTSNFATNCWKITSDNAIIGIAEDEILTVNTNSIIYRFRVISVSSPDIIIIPLDNGIPVFGMQFVNPTGASFITNTVIPPTVDKYSGDMLFIDNESSFIATSGSAAVLRTVINF